MCKNESQLNSSRTCQMGVTFTNPFKAGWRTGSEMFPSTTPTDYQQAREEVRVGTQLYGLSRNLWHVHTDKESEGARALVRLNT